MMRRVHPVAVVVAAAVVLAACGSDESLVTDSTTSAGVLTEYEDLSNGHIDPPFSSELTSPPVGGDHYPFWHNCGFYEVELLDGAATHSLEHGIIWITYNPALVTDSERESLREMAETNTRLLISPYGHDERFVLSAWGAQLRGPEGIDAPEVGRFITNFLDRSEAPEPGAACGGAAGVPPDDVRTLADGSTVPAEWT